MAASSNPCIFTGSRGHLDESAKNNIELPRASFAKVLKIIQREDEENLQREAELRLEAEQAERAAEDARLRELYPLPEDEQEYEDEQYEGEAFSHNEQLDAVQDIETNTNEEKKR